MGPADWLRDLIRDNGRRGEIKTRNNGDIRTRVVVWWDSAQGWIASFVIGLLTACVASVVDVSVETVSDWKEGYCTANVLLNRRACCALGSGTACKAWRPWATTFGASYAVYVAFALVFGVISASLTMTTKVSLPVVGRQESRESEAGESSKPQQQRKVMYMAAGSGIPEIKTILSGFVIPHFLSAKVLAVKAAGAVFAVATGMCLGKEGPFVHISTCVGYLVATAVPKYAANQRKLREMLSVACSAGLSVAFGAPIGGVLFSYEEISTYFPRQVLWRSFLCSLVAAAALKELNPLGNGKLLLFETKYGVDYDFVHYLVFIFLGVCGGIFGGVFCYANYAWSKSFRQLPLIKRGPVLEVALVVLLTALLQYPNCLIREPGDVVMQRLLVDCNNVEEDWICRQEAKLSGKGPYYAWLVSGTFVKLLLTIITFGCKVPSGVIIPALDAGALFGRMVGQLVPGISPGIFAMVGSAAFLAGVSRMTVSLAVIMFELTGEVNFIPPFMIAILIGKWVADRISADGVYDLSQHLMGHPFLEPEQAISTIKALRDTGESLTVEALLRPARVMGEIVIEADTDLSVPTSLLRAKLASLEARGLMDAGLLIVNEAGICHGYLPADGLVAALRDLEQKDMGQETSTSAPLEYAVEIIGKLGSPSISWYYDKFQP
ncbi:H(+)/Cl(-) exchange transporter 4 [Escovopsis weberi]|uniref:H(+)/Cl(-) exchange transporter 4 n=1 Tax=Escovopsis weberi TaxID=150374 RepID=A0A0N0RU79_ESCWE|nr:H(+)/Cl(-) exchange transporter 4 [Escovopsis weberi]